MKGLDIQTNFKFDLTEDVKEPTWEDELAEEWLYPCSVCGKKIHDDFLQDRIHEAIHNDKTLFVAWIGDTRNGKSWSEIIHGCNNFDEEHFGIDDIIFPANDNLENLCNWYETHEKSLCILEEITTSDARDWWSLASRTLQSLVNTQGYLNNIIFLNSPELEDFPRSVRRATKYRILSTRKGTYVKNFVHAKRKYPDWKSDKTIIRWSQVFTYKGIKARDERTKYILEEYVERKKKWNLDQKKNQFYLKSRKTSLEPPKKTNFGLF